jgi:hypothetical protein
VSDAKSLRARWQGAYHRRAIPGDEGPRGRILDTGSRGHGRGTGVGTQGRRCLSGAG